MTYSSCYQRFLVSNALTVYYSVITLISFAIAYLTNPFKNPWELKLRLMPPACLSDPKYGVHKYVKANVSIFNFNVFYDHICFSEAKRRRIKKNN